MKKNCNMLASKKYMEKKQTSKCYIQNIQKVNYYVLNQIIIKLKAKQRVIA